MRYEHIKIHIHVDVPIGVWLKYLCKLFQAPHKKSFIS